MIAKRLSAVLVVGLPLAYAACGGDNLTLPSEGEPASIAVVEGNGQSGRVGAALADSLIVLVTDTKNRPVAGATVEFAFDDAASGGNATPPSSVTDANGRASSQITLGTHVGTVGGHVRVPVAASSVPIQAAFTATALSAGANGIAAVSGDGQTGQVGSVLPNPLVVQVTDGFGNPIAGIAVAWSVTGGGSVSESSVQTDANGQASVTRTLGNTAGAQTTLATAAGLAGSPVTFTHTAIAGNAARVDIVSGNNQSAAAGSELPDPIVVQVLDAESNPISGRAVAWVVGAGGGTLASPTSTTDGQGRASNRWTLGSTPGNNTVNAVVSGVGTATFTATGTGTGTPSVLAITTQPPAVVNLGDVLTPAPVVQIQDNDKHDVAIAGVDVTVALASVSSSTLGGTLTVASDATGRATFADLKVTGAGGNLRLIFAADGYRSVTSKGFLVNNPPVAAFTWVCSQLTCQFQDQSRDPDGDPLTFDWNFGDGTPHSTQQNPTHTYAVAGSYTVTLTVQDSHGATSQASVQNDVFVAPVANNDSYSTPVGVPLVVPPPGILGNDTGDGPLTPTVSTQPQNGTLNIGSDGSFTYTPNPAFTGTDSFKYHVTDSHSQVSNDATVSIVVS